MGCRSGSTPVSALRCARLWLTSVGCWLNWTGLAKVRPTLTGHRDVAVAAGLFWDAVTEGTLVHRGQVELTRGVLSAKQRPMLGGQAFGWDRKKLRVPLCSWQFRWRCGVWSVISLHGPDAANRGARPSSCKERATKRE